MELAVLNKNIPLKAYPEQDLNRIILTVLMPFISGLLSLTDETSANRLKIALPAIKEQCHSMGFSEIKKMFEMYADGKLSVKPIPNYFDRILLGQIFKAYKSESRTKPKKTDEKEFKELQDFKWVVLLFDSFIQDRVIPDSYHWVYTYLEGKGLIEYSVKEKNTVFKLTGSKTKTKCKLIQRYFEQLEAKEQHVKDLL